MCSQPSRRPQCTALPYRLTVLPSGSQTPLPGDEDCMGDPVCQSQVLLYTQALLYSCGQWASVPLPCGFSDKAHIPNWEGGRAISADTWWISEPEEGSTLTWL